MLSAEIWVILPKKYTSKPGQIFQMSAFVEGISPSIDQALHPVIQRIG